MLNDLKIQYKQGGVVTKIIFWNVFLFAFPLVVKGILALFSVSFEYLNWVSLSSNPSELLYKPWSIITYAFFHFDFLHLLFNMFFLHFVGQLFQTYFTQKQFLGVYFMGLLFSGGLYMVSYLIFPALLSQVVSMVGASGAIAAVMFAVAAYAPYMPVRLLLLGTVKLWHIAVTFLVLDIIQLPYQNTGGHLAHLGGALFGYLYIVQLKKGHDWSKGFTTMIDGFENIVTPKKTKPFVKIHRNIQTKPIVNKTHKTKAQQQIDDILDKISKSGYDSLSKDEKDFLFKVGKE